MDHREELLTTVASLYYKMNKSQSEIASRLEMSPSTVSRLIKEARERGIVEIHIRVPMPRDFEMEQVFIETPHDKGPFGARGIGEPPILAVSPAVANAIYDAVGVRITSLPITAEKVRQAIKEKQLAEA